jgi:agmatine/peptidylarginine deiminase
MGIEMRHIHELPKYIYHTLMSTATPFRLVIAFIAAFILFVHLNLSAEVVLPGANASSYTQPPENKIRSAYRRLVPVPTRVPGEFGRQSAVLLAGNILIRSHPEVYAQLVREISERAPVVSIISSAEESFLAREVLDEYGVSRNNVHFLFMPLDTIWIRDYGPIFVRRSDGSAVAVDTYYSTRKEDGSFRAADDKVAVYLANLLDIPCSYLPLQLEGGNFLSNGDGLLLASSRIAERNQARNYLPDEIGRLMSTYFGFRSWVMSGYLPQESTGHVDMFATFLAHDTAVVASIDEREYPQEAAILNHAAKLLSQEITTAGTPVKVHRIPMPGPVGDYWRSYTNIFMVNKLLLMPSFSNVPAVVENRVEKLYRTLLPDYKIVKVPADDLVEYGGFLHCMLLGIPHFVDPTNLLELQDGLPTMIQRIMEEDDEN